MNIGRKEIWTDVEEITPENIIPVLQEAMLTFTQNASDCNELLNFDKGIQPLQRKQPKKYRPDIDFTVCDNICHQIVEFKLGFNFCNPITLVQRGEKDSGTTDEAEAISLLNECYEAEQIKKKTQELARFIEICGIGFTIVDVNTEWEDGESYFKVNVLDPRYAFVIKSSYYVDHRVMLGVSFRNDNKGNYYFTCFSKDRRYEILNATRIIKDGKEEEINDWSEKEEYIKKNYLGRIPITEYIRSHDRTGCFEHCISEANNLNLLLSDYSNSVDQNVQAIWHTNDVEFPTVETTDANGNTTETTIEPESNDWVHTFTTPEGRTPFINPLSINYDYEGMLNHIQAARARILIKCDVPQRNDNSGGSTGSAMDSATGYAAAETAAEKEQGIIEGCKMEEVKSVLAAIRESEYVPVDSPLLKLRYMDMQPSIKRNKNYELTTKANFFATMISHGTYGLHALKKMDAFEDVNQVWEDSKPLIEAYQNSIFNKNNEAVGGDGEKNPNADRLEQDESDQVSNSPLIDGMSTDRG